MFAIKLLPSAKNEIVNAYKWYEEKSIGLGSKFMESLFDELKFINNPLIEP